MTNTRLYSMITDNNKSVITKAMSKKATKRQKKQRADSFIGSVDFYKAQMKKRVPPRG